MLLLCATAACTFSLAEDETSPCTMRMASRNTAPLHLAALRNGDVHVRHVLAAVAGLSGLHLLDDVEAVDDLAEYDVFAVEEGSRHGGDEELGAVGVGACVLGCVSFSSSGIWRSIED